MGKDEWPIAQRIVTRAAACSLEIASDTACVLARHMQRVLDADPTLHLTAIDDPADFLERHVGESLEGASLIEPALRGALLDLGSGNGYPGLPVAACRRGLRPILAEASRRKAAFLRTLLVPDFPGELVIERQVQRSADLGEHDELAALLCRGMGNWERVLPRLAPRLGVDGRLLLWAGERVGQVSKWTAWRRLRLLERRALPGRDRSWIWLFSYQL